MAAKDYKIVTGCFSAYLAKETKSRKNIMSTDRRVITDSEIIGLFEFWLKRYCVENKVDFVTIRNSNGEMLFEAEAKGVFLQDIIKTVELENKANNENKES